MSSEQSKFNLFRNNIQNYASKYLFNFKGVMFDEIVNRKIMTVKSRQNICIIALEIDIN